MRCLQPTMHGSTVCHVEHSCIADCRAVHGMESSASIRRHKPLTASDLLLQFLHPLMQKSICTIIDAICCCQHLGDLSMTELRELLLQLCNLVFKEQVLHPGKAFPDLHDQALHARCLDTTAQQMPKAFYSMHNCQWHTRPPCVNIQSARYSMHQRCQLGTSLVDSLACRSVTLEHAMATQPQAGSQQQQMSYRSLTQVSCRSNQFLVHPSLIATQPSTYCWPC